MLLGRLLLLLLLLCAGALRPGGRARLGRRCADVGQLLAWYPCNSWARLSVISHARPTWRQVAVQTPQPPQGFMLYPADIDTLMMHAISSAVP